LYDSEWVQLADFIRTQWPESIRSILCILSPADEEDKQHRPGGGGADDGRISMHSSKTSRVNMAGSAVMCPDVDDMNKSVQKWLQETINAFENENTNMMEQVQLSRLVHFLTF